MCDLGCGAGALLLLLAARESTLKLSGVEISPEDGALARQNLAENGLTGTVYTGELQAVCKTLPAGGFSLAVSNPPYFAAGRGCPGGTARTEGESTLDGWCAAAGQLLKNGGGSPWCTGRSAWRSCSPPSRPTGLEPKRLQLVQHGRTRPPPPPWWRRCGRAGRGWRCCPPC